MHSVQVTDPHSCVHVLNAHWTLPMQQALGKGDLHLMHNHTVKHCHGTCCVLSLATDLRRRIDQRIARQGLRQDRGAGKRPG